MQPDNPHLLPETPTFSTKLRNNKKIGKNKFSDPEVKEFTKTPFSEILNKKYMIGQEDWKI